MSTNTPSNPEPSAHQRPKLRVVAPPPAIFFIPLLVTILLDRKVLHLPPMSAQLEWLGAALVVAAMVLIVWAIAVMRRFNTTVNPYGKSTAIVSDAPFSFTRNPIYLGFVLAYVGIAIFYRSWLPFTVLPILLWIMHAGVITREEKYLEGVFGEPYTSYKSRVRRWL